MDEDGRPAPRPAHDPAVPRTAASSSARVVVVPTAITRRRSARARVDRAAAACAQSHTAPGSTTCSSTIVDAHRLERAVADVQRDRRAARRPRVERLEERRRRSAGRRSAPPPIRERARRSSDTARGPAASSGRWMYGGSGTCPIASTSASTPRPRPSRVECAACRRTAARGSLRESPASGPLPSNRRRAPGLSFWPGMHQRGPELSSLPLHAPLVRHGPSSRHSTAPPLGTRWPSSRAGNTRVSLTTSRSPARRKRGRSRIRASRHRAAARSSTSSRDSPRGAASCAINSSGRWKSKSGYQHGMDVTEVRRRLRHARSASAARNRRSAAGQSIR